MSATLRYRADIDGLRAVAVLLVLIFHADLGVVSGGFIGVDVFFVISGYLITSIIVSEVSRGTFSWASFYERRIRRIMPALLTVILVSAVIGWFVLAPRDYMEFGRSAIAAAAFYSNFYFDGQAGYFAPAAETQPLLHTWSLGVEEQFYLLAPAFILLLLGRLQRFKLVIFLTLFVLSLGIAVWGVREEWSSAFYLLPSRAFELMIGMALALGLVPAITSRVVRQVAGLAGLAMIVAAGLLYDSTTPFPGLAALVPCLGAALLIHSGGQGDTLASRVLALRPAVFVGKVSYSLYLWHWPLLAYAAYEFEDQLTNADRIGLLVLAFVLSVLSYYWIEQPARRGTILPTRRGAFTATAAAIAACAVMSIGIYTSRGAPIRLNPEAEAFARRVPLKYATLSHCLKDSPGGSCAVGAAAGAVPTFILWGDSHARMMSKALAEVAASQSKRGFISIAQGCPPILRAASSAEARSKCLEGADQFEALAAGSPTAENVIVAAYWLSYSGGLARNVETPEAQARLVEAARALRSTVEKLSASGRSVTLIGPVPGPTFDLTKEMTRALMRGYQRDFSVSLVDFKERHAGVLRILSELDAMPRVRVLYPHLSLCDADRCRLVDNGMPLYVDDNHLSPQGAGLLSDLLREALDGASLQHEAMTRSDRQSH